MADLPGKRRLRRAPYLGQTLGNHGSDGGTLTEKTNLFRRHGADFRTRTAAHLGHLWTGQSMQSNEIGELCHGRGGLPGISRLVTSTGP